MDVFPRECAAISAALLSRSWRCCSGEQVFTAGSGGFVSRCGVKGILNICAVSPSGLSRASLAETAVSSSEFLKMSKHSPVESFDTELFINEIAQLLAIWN